MSEVAASIETMGAQFALGQTYCFHQIFKFAELQRLKSETAAHNLHQLFVFGTVGSGILFQILVFIAFQFLYYASRYKFKVAFRACEAYERATVDERWACYAYVHLFGSAVIEHLYIVAQLRPSHYRVVAEHHALVFQYGRVGYELHLGHEVAAALVARRE